MQKSMDRLKGVERLKGSELLYAFYVFICSFISSYSLNYVLNACYVPITARRRWIQQGTVRDMSSVLMELKGAVLLEHCLQD